MDMTIKEVINFLDTHLSLDVYAGSFTETNAEMPERENGISFELTNCYNDERIIIDLFADGHVHCYKAI